MRYYSIIWLLALSLSGIAQKKVFKVGDRVNISADLYTDEDAKKSIIIPEKKYTIFYNYSWAGGEHDGKDSISRIEDIITKFFKLYKVPELRVICCSYDKGSNYHVWVEMIKHRPFKEKAKCTFEYYNTNDYSEVSKTLKGLFGKIALIEPEGKLIAASHGIIDFGRQVEELPGVSEQKLKARLLTDSSGKRKPLVKTLVCLVNELKEDTFAKARTDEYGDFEMLVPESERATYELAVKYNPGRAAKVIFAAQNNAELGEFDNSTGNYKYKLLKADLIRLQEIESSDIDLAFRSFKHGTDMQLKVIESIVYGSGKFNIEKSAEEILNKVVNIMKENPYVKLEIISHTDSQGDDAKNMSLSEKRANSVVNYMMSKGINLSRLKAVGKGETNLRNRCANGVECTDKEHEFNRRTEFNFTKAY